MPKAGDWNPAMERVTWDCIFPIFSEQTAALRRGLASHSGFPKHPIGFCRRSGANGGEPSEL